MKITINDVWSWDRDYSNIHGDASHEGYSNVEQLVCEEENTIEEHGWPNLPFTYDADTDDLDYAIADAIDEYVYHHTDFHYVTPVDVDYEVEEE